MAKKIEKNQYTPAQKKVVEYFRELCETDPAAAEEELGKFIRLRADGTRIEGAELAKVFDKLGYFGAEEVSKTTWDFCDELTGMYKRLRKHNTLLRWTVWMQQITFCTNLYFSPELAEK